MPSRMFALDEATAQQVGPRLQRLRGELEIPETFPDAALAEAERAAQAPPSGGIDATDVELVTIDPPGSRDLDQALHLARDGDGYLVRYAIADPASFISPGGPLDQAVQQRGVTCYGPDGRIGLHPDVLAEGAASLLPDQVRPACLWQIRLDADGEIAATEVVRAQVRSRAKLTYQQVQLVLDGGTDAAVPAWLELLREVGTLRQQREADRGGASLRIPEQEIVEVDGRYELRYRTTLDVEEWNAQISLTTGHRGGRADAAQAGGRAPHAARGDPHDVKRLRRAAQGLGIDWPHTEPYGQLLRRLDAAVPAHAAFLNEATTLFRGAGYLAFHGELPPSSPHGAIGAEYAHVTAPLRRLVDRFGLEICLAATAGTDVPAWVVDGLTTIAETMATTTRRSNGYERECVNLVEAVLLAPRVGERFQGVVVDVGEPRKGEPSSTRGTVVVSEPAVRATLTGDDLPLGEATQVTLSDADPDTRTVAFTHP